jgi:hypothetical protein
VTGQLAIGIIHELHAAAAAPSTGRPATRRCRPAGVDLAVVVGTDRAALGVSGHHNCKINAMG